MTRAGQVLVAVAAALLVVGGMLYLLLGDDDRAIAAFVLRLGIAPLPLAIPLLIAGARQGSG